mgnify:CR=1 FL=1
MPAGQPPHGDYLWGNPALACACLIGQAFTLVAYAVIRASRTATKGANACIASRSSPVRGKPCEPAFLVHTVRQVAALRGQPADEVERLTAENTRRRFGLDTAV